MTPSETMPDMKHCMLRSIRAEIQRESPERPSVTNHVLYQKNELIAFCLHALPDMHGISGYPEGIQN